MNIATTTTLPAGWPVLILIITINEPPKQSEEVIFSSRRLRGGFIFREVWIFRA